MSFNSLVKSVLVTACVFTGVAANAQAQQAATPVQQSSNQASDSILLTIFLRHDQSKPLSQIDAQLNSQDFFKTFPPAGIKVVSWYVLMGIGQVVTLEVPASRLREVNRAIETSAWGGFRTEFYPTYDYKSEAIRLHTEALSK